jgi:CubicO group peptidase (beta-lactamase class C family)
MRKASCSLWVVFIFIPILLLAVPVSLATGQTQFPDTPAAHQCAAWLQAFNGSDREAFRTFVKKNYPLVADHVDQEWQFHEMTGGFALKKIEESTPTKFVALVQERASDQFGRLSVEVDGAEPHVITQLNIRAIPRPADFALPHLAENELIVALRKELEQDAATDHFTGAVLLAKNGKPIFSEAYGLADRERKVANSLTTRFRIGSMNKMFTATAVLQLVQAGKVGLDDPLGKYLTDYPNKDLAAKVTISQLLTHTGGTGDIFGPEFDAHRLELRTLQDYVGLYGKRDLEFAPRWEYSNYGFILLGLVIEKVSGESYYTYVHDNIYAPAGMTSSGSEPEDQPVPNRSLGYTKMGPEKAGAASDWRLNTDTLPYRGTSAGGGYSTVEDLLKFANALQDRKLLNEHYTELLTTGKVDTPRGRYAYGFGDLVVNGTRCFGHAGGAPGMNGELQVCPAHGYVIAVLSNLDPPAASRISDFITNRLPER